MNLGSYRVVQYSEKYYESFRDLSLSFAPDDHSLDYIYHTKSIFENLYVGFGHNESKSLLLLNENDRVVGFRGVIPSLYQVPNEKNSYNIIKGNGLTGWIIDKKIEGVNGIGLKLHMIAQKNLDVTVAACFGFETSYMMYKANRFQIIDSLNRYVMPLNMKGYRQIIHPSHDGFVVKEWCDAIQRKLLPINTSEPKSINSESMFNLWKEIMQFRPIFGLYRNSEFWDWRYIKCPYNNYLFFGDPKNEGVVIARIEKIIFRKGQKFDSASDLYGKKIFRIIEIIPRCKKVWLGGVSKKLSKVILSTLKWAKDNQCLAVDFQFSDSMFDNQMTELGFRKQSHDYKPYECSLAGLFQPFKLSPDTINVAWKVNGDVRNNPRMLNYFVKSDVAGDHPKFWPMPL